MLWGKKNNLENFQNLACVCMWLAHCAPLGCDFWNMQCIPVCDRGSLWAGRSLTASVGEQAEDGKCALSPGHCTDTLLVSAAGQAERARDAEENGEGSREREREFLHLLRVHDG